jgi:hypothetical protein
LDCRQQHDLAEHDAVDRELGVGAQQARTPDQQRAVARRRGVVDPAVSPRLLGGLRVRDKARDNRLHADLTILAKLARALARARAMPLAA